MSSCPGTIPIQCEWNSGYLQDAFDAHLDIPPAGTIPVLGDELVEAVKETMKNLGQSKGDIRNDIDALFE
ncbi:hypothetical protein [uncultured Cohaesibacter sp.]|uniref:hypothetical protein n=1 Tax=uncultured Cohaesibacter sp. TaxID=1002546 RepID=UPI0029C6EA59|nr:hypothetical protein [uncultured Cohaesibacter sp.]